VRVTLECPYERGSSCLAIGEKSGGGSHFASSIRSRPATALEENATGLLRRSRVRPRARRDAKTPPIPAFNDANKPGPRSPDSPATCQSPSGLKSFPFQPAIGAFERPIDVVVTRISGACIGFGQSHFIVYVRVLMAKAAAAGSTCSSSVFFTEPAFHNINSSAERAYEREQNVAGQSSEVVLQDRGGPAAQLASVVRPDAGAPVPEAARLRHQQVV